MSVDLSDAPEGPMPHDVEPMLATPVSESFDREGWLFEIKWDGYRAIAEVANGDVRLYSRNNLDFKERFHEVADSLKKFGHDAVLDGEVVVLDDSGVPRFSMLQYYHKERLGRLVYYVFDLLWLDGRDLRRLPLVRRKEILQEILPDLDCIKYSDHVESDGLALFQIAAERGIEGVMAKDASSPYREGRRSREWLKIRALMRQETVIGGFTEPRGSRKGVGAVVVGVYQDGDLVYIGHVGAGSDERSLTELLARLEPLIRPTSPFSDTPKTNAPVHWVEPVVVCEVSFNGWTREGKLRQPIFLGVREDINAADVRMEAAPASPTDLISDLPERPPQRETTVEIGGINLKLTNLHKTYFPEDGYTKGDVIAYYRDIAPVILPYLRDRPESLHRHPDGIIGESFYHKDAGEIAPEWVETVKIRSESGDRDINYILCQDEAALIYMANLGCIEFNPWFSRVGSLNKPDYLVLDLDPENIGFDQVIEAANIVRDILEEAGAQSYCKTSGATGLHIYLPLAAAYGYDQARQFAQIVANLANGILTNSTSVLRNPSRRQNRVYLDYLQNRRGQTLAAPYCIRPRSGAPVATPLLWEEVGLGLDPSNFTIANISDRLSRIGDIFSPVLTESVDLRSCLRRLQERYCGQAVSYTPAPV